MQLLEKLIETTRFAQANAIWQEGLSDDVFEPFFACMLASMAGESGFAYYDGFVRTTYDSARMSLTAGGDGNSLNVFWDKEPHQLMRQKIADATLVDENVLTVVLPLAVHSSFALLQRIAENSGTTIQPMIRRALPELLPKLPAWASLVLDEHELIRLSMPANADEYDDDNDEGDDESDDDLASMHVASKQGRSVNPVAIGVLGVLALLAVGGGYYYWQKNQTPAPVAEVATPTTEPLVVQNFAPSRLSMTVGQKGELYACHAELGSTAMSERLIALLQSNFASTLCVIDIDESLSKDMVGFDKLTSVLGVLKTAPFASLELQGNTMYINAQQPSDISRLVNDIGAMMAGVSVQPAPILNATNEISTSLVHANEAMTALATPIDGTMLARALSVQKFDTNQSTLSEAHQAVLAMGAEHLKNNVNIRLLIVAHRDDIGNDEMARTQTQAFADLIKNDLVAKGVSADQLTTIGVGSKLPASDNVTEWGRFKNRRVEFLVYDDAIVQALTTAVQSPVNNQVVTSTSNVQPTYTVVDGQIVEQSVANQLLAQKAEAQMQAQAQTPIQAPASTPAQAPTQMQTQAPRPPAGNQIVPPLPSHASSTPQPPMPISEGGGVVVPSPTATIMPASPSSTTGNIDADLLVPIGIEPMYGGSAVERANR